MSENENIEDVWIELIKEKLIKDKNYEALLDLEETKQQDKIMSDDEIERIPYNSSSLSDDPIVNLYLKDIIKNCCQNCPDSKCQSLVYMRDLEVFRDCPKALTFIETHELIKP